LILNHRFRRRFTNPPSSQAWCAPRCSLPLPAAGRANLFRLRVRIGDAVTTALTSASFSMPSTLIELNGDDLRPDPLEDNSGGNFPTPAARLDVALPRLRRAVGIPCQGLCHGKRHAMHEPFAQRLAAELLGHALQEDMPEIGRDRLRSLHQFMHLRTGESERPHCLPRGRVPRRSFRQAGAIRNTTRRICPVKRARHPS
jgi:hypothetical protein